MTAAPVNGIDLSLLWGTTEHDVARRERVRQAVLAVPGAGRTLMLFVSEPLPGSDPGGPEVARGERARCLLAACEYFQSAPAPDAKLAQGLPEPHERWAHEAFTDAGFQTVGTLSYLKRRLDSRPTTRNIEREWPEGVRVVSAAALGGRQAQDVALLEALESTYINTRDCPELCGLRETADVLASHRATGTWDPDLWWVVFDRDRARGCLLLNRCPEQRTVELVYLGLSPDLRGRGLAARLLGMGAEEAAGPLADELTCAVDQRNTPALALYARAGFRPTAERVAFVKPIVRAVRTPGVHGAT